MIRVRVPATSANMGAGFDCLGVAVNLYNRIELSETDAGLEIIMKNAGYAPQNEDNLIYRAAKRVFDEVGYKARGLRIVQSSQIPMTRGLGSSSACIIGGMLAANAISGRTLPYGGILDLAAEMEGHPDNVTPALYGGFCAACMEDGHVVSKSLKLKSDISFAVMIPDYFLRTKLSRTALPEMIPHKTAAFNVGRAALMAMALADGDYSVLKTASEDALHQPYRREYIEGMDSVFKKAYELGARAVWLSGSGPAIMAIIQNKTRAFRHGMNDFFEENLRGWSCRMLHPDNVGAVLCEV